MAKKSTVSAFICDSCEKPHYKFQPSCFDCGGSIIENKPKTAKGKTGSISNIERQESRYDIYTDENDFAEALPLIAHKQNAYLKLPSEELNYFFGSTEDKDGNLIAQGIAKSSFNLIYGNPGTGKSTFLGQLGLEFNQLNMTTLYNSGEEIKSQVKNRTVRIIGDDNPNYYIASHKNVLDLLEDVEKIKPDLLIVDSIQTMYTPNNNGVKGGVSQVREVTDLLMNMTKKLGIITFVIAHVNGEGELAGPTTLEHMVDAVYFLEKTKVNAYRILLSEKNRYGKSEEILIYKLLNTGLEIVRNPSGIFLEERGDNTIGSVVIPTMEGTTSMLLELQSLAVESNFNGSPMRNVSGFDRNRLIMLLAVMQKTLNMSFITYDVYVNIVGGIKTRDSSTDLGLVKSLMSSFTNLAVPKDTAYIGEVGLSGEIRSVSMIENRLKECEKLGLKEVYIPYHNQKDIENKKFKNLKVHYVKNILDIVEK